MLLLEGHQAPVLCVAYAPDCRTLASGSQDETVRLWDLSTGRATHVIPWAGGPVLSLAFTPDGRRLAVGSHSMVTLWDLETHECVAEYEGDHPGTYTVAFTPDSQLAVLCSYLDDRLTIWDPVADTTVGHLAGQLYGALSLAHAQSGQLLVSGGGQPAEGEVIIWDMESRKMHSVPRELQRGLLPPGGGWLSHLRVREYVRINNEAYCEFQAAHAQTVYAVACSPDASLVASGSRDRTVNLWSTKTGSLHRHLTGHDSPVVAVSFTPDGQTLLSAGEDGAIHFWDVETGRHQGTLDWRIGRLRSVVFSPDGMTAAAGGDRTVLAWDVDVLDH